MLSDTPFAWSYDNGQFSASVKVTYTTLGKLFGLYTVKTAYLAESGGQLTVSLDNGSSSEFIVRYAGTV